MSSYDTKTKSEFKAALNKIFTDNDSKDFEDFCMDLGSEVHKKTFGMSCERGINKLVEIVSISEIVVALFKRFWYLIDKRIGTIAEEAFIAECRKDAAANPKYKTVLEKDIKSWQKRSEGYFQTLMNASGISYDGFFKLLMYLPFEEPWILHVAKRNLNNTRGRKVIATLAALIEDKK